MRASPLQAHLHTADQHITRYEINLGLPEARGPTSLDGQMELDPSTSPSALPPTVARETGSRSESAK